MSQPQEVLQRFADARKRPALFYFVDPDLITRGHVLQLYDELRGRSFEELDLVIHSGGGDAHAAYQTMTLLRQHADRINACVPFWAKSAATLLCIGADRIVLGEHAELGPLDVQIYEEKEPGKGDFHSALNPFKALEQVQNFSLEALGLAMRLIVRDYGMSYDESLRHAVAFVEATTGPLVGRLDPERLGQYSRELSVAIDYGRRLLSRCTAWTPRQIEDVVVQLVYGYPSHEYIIDFPELGELGFAVELFSPDERESVEALRPGLVSTSRRSIIRLVEPAAQVGENADAGDIALRGVPPLTTAEIEEAS